MAGLNTAPPGGTYFSTAGDVYNQLTNSYGAAPASTQSQTTPPSAATPPPAQAPSGQPGTPVQSPSTPNVGTIPNPTPSTATIESQKSFQYNPLDQSKFGSYGSLFSPTASLYEQFGTGLQGAEKSFMEGAGPSRTYEGIGGRDTIKQAIMPGQTPEDKRRTREAALGLVQAEYRGPEELGDVPRGTEIEDTIKAMQGGNYLYDLLGQRNPNLTPGESRFEASRISMDPQYQTALGYLQEQFGGLPGELSRERDEARGVFGQRSAQENAIADMARSDLSGEYNAIRDPLEGLAGQRNAENAAVEAAWQKFLGSSRLADIETLPDESLVGFKPDQFRTERLGEWLEANKAAQDVMGRYSNISDIPLMTLGINSHGRQELQLPEGDWGQGQLDLIRQRQADLEAAGFDPRGLGAFTPQDTEAGKYATQLPLYFAGEDFARLPYQNILDYFTESGQGYKPGVAATWKNLADSQGREKLDIINDLLGKDAESWTDNPFTRASISANIDRFLGDEQKALEARKGQLLANEEQYLRDVRKARKKYKEQEKINKYANIARIVNNVALGAGTFGIGSALYEGERKQGSDGSGKKGGKDSTAGKTEQAQGRLAYNIFG